MRQRIDALGVSDPIIQKSGIDGKRILRQAKGYQGSRSTLFKTAREAVERGLRYAYRDRKQRKRQFRRLWIIRINAACRSRDITYSRFIEGLNVLGVDLDRKVLSDLAIHDEAAFGELAAQAKSALENKAKSAS